MRQLEIEVLDIVIHGVTMKYTEATHYVVFSSLLLYLPFGYKHSPSSPRSYSSCVYALCVLRETALTRARAHAHTQIFST